MKKVFYFVYLIVLVYGIIGVSTAKAQIVLAGDSICTANAYVLSTAFNNVSCVGQATGVATVASTGCQCMFSGCTFAWDNGEIVHTADSLAAGTYTVTVTHPTGCVISTTVTISEPEPFVSELQVSNPSCGSNEDGSIAVISSATAGTLTYAWNNGSTNAIANNLAAGNYTVTVTNAIGCSHVETREIVAPAPPQMSSSSQATCVGVNAGWASVTVSGGYPPFSYLWNDASNCVAATANNLAAGTYAVTVTDANGCEFVKNNIVVNTTTPVVAASAANNQVCVGQTVQLNAAGGNAYAWSPAASLSDANIQNPVATITANTTYVVTVTNAQGCTNTATVSVNVKSSPSPSVSPASPVVCGGNSIQLVATNTGGATYQWIPSTGLSSGNVNAPVANPNQTTTYTVVATGTNGCTASTQVTVSVCAVGINNLQQGNILVYPNPTQAGFYINLSDMPSNNLQMQLFDVTGRLVKTATYTTNGNATQYVAVDDLARGLYHLQLLGKDVSYLQKIMVQ